MGYFRKRRLRKDASPIPTAFVPLKDIHSITLLIDGAFDNVNPCAKALARYCKAHSCKFTLMYVDERRFSRRVRPTTPYETTITRKDLNWFGRPNLKKVAPLTQRETDLFICLTSRASYNIKYITTCAKARFKIGQRAFKGDPYNFVVSAQYGQKPDALELFEKITNLLTTIQ